MKTLYRAFVFNFLVACVCVTVAPVAARAAGNLTKINPVVIPNGLDSKDAKAAMVQAVAQTALSKNAEGKGDRWADIVDGLLSVRVWGYQVQASSRKAAWYVESVEKDAVVFGYRVRSHYLSVRMQISADRVSPMVVMSENLKQTKDSIHPNAINWITDLSTRIRMTLGQFSVWKAEVEEAESRAAAERARNARAITA